MHPLGTRGQGQVFAGFDAVQTREGQALGQVTVGFRRDRNKPLVSMSWLSLRATAASFIDGREGLNPARDRL